MNENQSQEKFAEAKRVLRKSNKITYIILLIFATWAYPFSIYNFYVPDKVHTDSSTGVKFELYKSDGVCPWLPFINALALTGDLGSAVEVKTPSGNTKRFRLIEDYCDSADNLYKCTAVRDNHGYKFSLFYNFTELSSRFDDIHFIAD